MYQQDQMIPNTMSTGYQVENPLRMTSNNTGLYILLYYTGWGKYKSTVKERTVKLYKTQLNVQQLKREASTSETKHTGSWKQT